MKKIYTLIIAAAFTFTADAQSSGTKSIVFGEQENAMLVPVHNEKPASANIPASYPKPISSYFSSENAKMTASSGRWYSYFEVADYLLGNTFTALSGGTPNLSWEPLWWDSTVTYRFLAPGGGTALYATEWGGVCQMIDPVRFSLFNDTSGLIPSFSGYTALTSDDFAIDKTHAYLVDTIKLRAAYIRRIGRPDTLKDTLIVCVAPQTNDFYYDTALNNDWCWHNTKLNRDIAHIFSPQPLYADSINRAVFVDNNASGAMRTIDTFILDPKVNGHLPDMSSGSEADTLQFYVFPVNKGLGNLIPAGQHFAVSVSFKSGDTWTPNLDSLKKFNNFCPVFGFEATGATPNNSQFMTYMQYQNLYDYNGSSYLDPRGRPAGNNQTYPYVNHTGRPTKWLSEFTIQNNNSTDGTGHFDQHLWVDAHITCSTCGSIRNWVNVSNVPGLVANVSVYPNPASDEAIIAFSLKNPTNVTITLSNPLGQVLMSKQIVGTATSQVAFDVSKLQAGVYLYTVQTETGATTGRLSVTH